MDSLHLKIFNNHYKVFSNNSEIIRRIGLDFSYFISDENQITNYDTINILVQSPLWEIIPEIVAKKQTDTSIIYENAGIRYNDYHGEALTTVDNGRREAFIYSNEMNLAHELGYLLILSKSGKKMDLLGFHKIHAMGLQFHGVNLLLISPSKGGKSTHFLDLLNNPEYKIYSDDTPVIDRKGHIYPFPLRVGIEENFPLPTYVNKANTYHLQRRKYGAKILIPLHAMNRDLATFDKSQRTVLVFGIRSRKNKAAAKIATNIQVIPHLIKYMVVGIGLPMILEYFLETGLKDFSKRFKIIFNRSIAAIILMLRSEKYILEMTSNIEENSTMLTQLCKTRPGKR